MNKKGIITMLIVIVLLLAGLFTLQFLTKRSGDRTEIQNEFGFSAENVIYYSDTHGGFHGDGETVIIFIPDEAGKEIMSHWQDSISVRDIKEFLYGSGETPENLVLEEYGFPLPNEYMRYYCNDRRSSDMTWNFNYAMYDTANNICYYFKFDS